MTVTLSSKGQLVIPKQIRDELQLEPGMEFDVHLGNHRQIVLTPVKSKEEILAALDRLQGMFAGADLIEDLEAEHRWEIERDEARIQSLGSR